MSNNAKKTERITIWGIVQGVGFRPFVTKLADRMNVNGQIKNLGGLVQLTISGTSDEIDSFIESIKKEKPDASEIVRIEREELPYEPIKGFSIQESEVRDDEIGMIPADMAVCDDCLREYNDPNDPRYRHPFISCMVCGPRYTIIDSLPYDRENTTMQEFPMCELCDDQYTDKSARRFHSQTVSCHDCGPMPEYHTAAGNIIKVEPGDKDREKAAEAAIKDINDGKVIALKGTGGYYFVCSPFNSEAVKTLREIKIREEKPFAVMFESVESIKDYCRISEKEAELIKSNKRPIVLLEKKEDSESKDSPAIKEIVPGVCRSSRYIGAFLPSFGLQYQLIEGTGPLIMTSANLSDLPIIFKDEDMLAVMKNQPKLSGVLLNRREIRMSLDDSVARIIDGTPQLTRRSKGYAPVPVYVETPFDLDKKDMIFATGGQLKAAFALSKGNFSYVSQYFGDLDSIESTDIYETNFHRMKKFFGINPSVVVSDLHPMYYTTAFAESYVANENKVAPKANAVKLFKVQHHHAHIASVMAEHGIFRPVIGVSFDGTGYGTDGNIWGGEFLICEGGEFERFSHLKYVDMIGGDSSMKEGWKSAVSHVMAQRNPGPTSQNTNDYDNGRELDISEIIDYSIREKTLASFREIPTVEAAIKNHVNTIKTSSMGRLFDAVSSLLGIQHINRYEGECAIMLENAAYSALTSPGKDESCDLALKFHEDVSKMILSECTKIKAERGISDVALSGGVFQNKILMEMTLKLLRENGFSVHYNVAVPTNDGGIALGQNYIGMYKLSTEDK